MPELKLRRIFPAVYFVKINPPEERFQVSLAEKELTELPDDSPNFSPNICGYMERPSVTFCN